MLQLHFFQLFHVQDLSNVTYAVSMQAYLLSIKIDGKSAYAIFEYFRSGIAYSILSDDRLFFFLWLILLVTVWRLIIEVVTTSANNWKCKFLNTAKSEYICFIEGWNENEAECRPTIFDSYFP